MGEGFAASLGKMGVREAGGLWRICGGTVRIYFLQVFFMESTGVNFCQDRSNRMSFK